MKLFFLIFTTLISTQSFAAPGHDLKDAENKCLAKSSLFEARACLNDIQKDALKEMSDMCFERNKKNKKEYQACTDTSYVLLNETKKSHDKKLEDVKQKRSAKNGSDYLSVCKKLNNNDPAREVEECKNKLSKALLGEAEIEFCKKTSSDKYLERKCLMNVANLSFSLSSLDDCAKSQGASPVFSCLDTKPSDAMAGKEKDPKGRADCQEFVVGSYIKCPEGKYVFVGDKLSPSVIGEQARAPKESIPDSSGSRSHAKKSLDR